MRTPAVPQINTAGGGMTGDILLMILYLVLILVGAYYATRLFARMAQRGVLLGGGKNAFRPGAYITLIDRLAVDKEHSVLLIKVNDAYYLIGMGEQVTLLEKLGALPEELVAQAEAQAPNAFQTVLDAWRERGKHEEE
ncbi:MAG: flagellar biosynthetic protein FliO [Eubacteriales bacterium]|nr:flagellar biosynthetic protein FliO [Eubacteriales bacterium]